MLSVQNMISEKTGRAIANQFLISDGDVVMFQSYDSPIVEIDYKNNTIRVYQDWNYSRTTAKYRNQFMREQGFHGLATKDGFAKCMNDGYCKGCMYGPNGWVDFNWSIIKMF